MEEVIQPGFVRRRPRLGFRPKDQTEMNKTITFLLILFMISVRIVSAGPEITIPASDFDFGKTVQRTILTHDFWIKSTGDL